MSLWVWAAGAAVSLCAAFLLLWATRWWYTRKIVAALWKWLDHVQSADAGAVYGRLHPQLRADVDQPILAAFLECVKDRLGKCERMCTASGQG